MDVPAALGSDGFPHHLRGQRDRPAKRTVVIAAGELLVAILLARMISSSSEMHPRPPHGDYMGMGAGSMSEALEPNWNVLQYSAAAVAGLGLGWWLARRHAIAAIVSATGLAVLATSAPVRILATQSHLISMVALEVLLVVAPLLVIQAIPIAAEPREAPPSRFCATTFAMTAGLFYAGLLIAVHVPALHRRAAHDGEVPLWVAIVALLIGLAYWVGILRLGDRVSVRARRSILIGAQEVAAFIGLLSLFSAWGAMGHPKALGLSTATDQRLGGLLMIIACGAVTIPISRRLGESRSEET